MLLLWRLGTVATQLLDNSGSLATLVPWRLCLSGDPGPVALVADNLKTPGALAADYLKAVAHSDMTLTAKFKKTGEKPQVTPGLDFFDTGVALVTDKPVSGLESIDSAAASKICWG